LLLADVANSATLELASSDSSIFAVESTGDNKIVICDRNGAVTEWQIQGSSSGLARPTAVLLRSVHEHSGPAFAVQWDKWHRCILSVGADGYQRSLDVRTGARSAVKCSDHALFSMIVSDSYDFVAVGTQDGLINIFKGNKQQTFAGHSDAVRSVSISPKARWLASGSKDASVRLWDVSTGRAWLLVQTQDYVYEVAFSPTGNHILAVDGAGVMRVISFPRLIDELSPNDVDKMCANV
jgi:WD40 repeat protein